MNDCFKGGEKLCHKESFFRRTDWLSFGAATAIALAVYIYTLSPEVTLDSSGIAATAASYGAVGMPPGAPLWTIYAWVFTKILPFSNFAWRVAISSAVAGALTCGVIALLVSRGSLILLKGAKGFKRLPSQEELYARGLCGVVAGLAFGFHGVFWNLAVIVGPDALGLLMIATVLCLLLRYACRPRQSRYLYAAAFIYGLSLTVQISLAALAPALPLVVLFIRPAAGRDLLVVTALALGLLLALFTFGLLPEIVSSAGQFENFCGIYRNLAIFYALVSIWPIIRTRRLFTCWRVACIAPLLSISGLFLYFYLPIASMTNPPANWGYARTVEGFFNLIRRGQFERLTPMDVIGEFSRYLEAIGQYCRETIRTIGWPYSLPWLSLFLFFWKIRGRAKSWLLGLGVCLLSLSLLVLLVLNPPTDRGAWSVSLLYCLPSHLVLTVWTGYGLVLLGSICGQFSWRRHYHEENPSSALKHTT
jgi:hypothetical protein